MIFFQYYSVFGIHWSNKYVSCAPPITICLVFVHHLVFIIVFGKQRSLKLKCKLRNNVIVYDLLFDFEAHRKVRTKKNIIKLNVIKDCAKHKKYFDFRGKSTFCHNFPILCLIFTRSWSSSCSFFSLYARRFKWSRCFHIWNNIIFKIHFGWWKVLHLRIHLTLMIIMDE